jgi:transcriptional regulator with XRE-family HTH domain
VPDVGLRIRAARLARGLTQQDLARAAGIAQADVWRIERGLTNPTVRPAERLLEVSEAGFRPPQRFD